MKTKNLWPIGIVSSLVLFFLGTVALVVIAGSHPNDLVSSNYYYDEVRFQKQIESVARARSLETGAQVVYDRITREIRLSVPPRSLEPSAHGQIYLYRPSSAGLDRRVELKLDASGAQRINASEIHAGLWRVKVSWTDAGGEYFFERQLVVGDMKL